MGTDGIPWRNIRIRIHQKSYFSPIENKVFFKEKWKKTCRPHTIPVNLGGSRND